MRKNIISVFISFFLLVGFVNAQDSTEVLVPKLKKNEFSISFSTIPTLLNATPIFNTNSKNSTLYFSYKRAFNKTKLRTSIFLETQKLSGGIPNQIYLSDSSLSFQQKTYSKSNGRINIGIQNNSKAKKFQFTFGFDLILGMLEDREIHNITNYKFTDSLNLFDRTSTSLNQNVFNVKNSVGKYMYIGFSPVFGIDYVLNKNWSVGFFISPEIYYKIGTDEKSSKNNNLDFNHNSQFTLTLKL